MKKLKLLLNLGILALSTALLTSCAAKIMLYPILQTDIYYTDKGDICMSEKYFSNVLQAKIEEFK